MCLFKLHVCNCLSKDQHASKSETFSFHCSVLSNVVKGFVNAVLIHATFDHVYLDSRVQYCRSPLPLLNNCGKRNMIVSAQLLAECTHYTDLTRRPENAMPPPLKKLKGIFLKPDRRVTAAAANPFGKSARGGKTLLLSREKEGRREGA